MKQTESHSGAGVIVLIVVGVLIVVVVLALGPITGNLAEVQAQRTSAIQAQEYARAQIAAEREATARQEAALRAESGQQTTGYLVILVGGIIAIVAGLAVGGLLMYALEWAGDRRQARADAHLLLMIQQAQAGALPALQAGMMQLPAPQGERAGRAVVLAADGREVR
jgi:hypothetical protein